MTVFKYDQLIFTNLKFVTLVWFSDNGQQREEDT